MDSLNYYEESRAVCHVHTIFFSLTELLSTDSLNEQISQVFQIHSICRRFKDVINEDKSIPCLEFRLSFIQSSFKLYLFYV